MLTVSGLAKVAIFITNVDKENQTLINHPARAGSAEYRTATFAKPVLSAAFLFKIFRIKYPILHSARKIFRYWCIIAILFIRQFFLLVLQMRLFSALHFITAVFFIFILCYFSTVTLYSTSFKSNFP